MRELAIGDKTLRVRATPLALLFYRQEFNADLIAGLMAMQAMQTDLTAFDSVTFLQIVWAMAKADAPHGYPGYETHGFPGFEAWLGTLEGFDFSDADLMAAVVEEATSGFFRGAAARLPAK